MNIGDYTYCLETNKREREYVEKNGILDFHTHLRLKPLIELAKKGFFANHRILEIGCGNGINGFEIDRYTPDKSCISWYLGVDMQPSVIRDANIIKNRLKLSNYYFERCDAFQFLKKNEKFANADIVILYDFLEHIKDPEVFLQELRKCLKRKKVVFIVSVPTTMYPEVFGRKFHQEVGHVMDGFTIELLDETMKSIGGIRRKLLYNTGIVGNVGAALFYHLLPTFMDRITRFKMCKPFLKKDYNGKKVSSSIFSIYTA